MNIKITPILPDNPEYAANFSDADVEDQVVSIDGKWDGSVEVNWFVGCGDGNETIYVGDLDYMINFLMAARDAAREHFRKPCWPNE